MFCARTAAEGTYAAHAFHAGEGIGDVDVGVVGEVEGVVAFGVVALEGCEEDDVGRLGHDRHALFLDGSRELRVGLCHAVLHLYGGIVEVGAHLKGDCEAV